MYGEEKLDSWDVCCGRIALILIAIAFVAISVIELAVALNIEFTRMLARKAMWAGSVLWMITAITGWVAKFKNELESPAWCLILFTAIAAGSIAGMYIPTFIRFAVWANTILSALFLPVIVWTFPERWRNCAAVPAAF